VPAASTTAVVVPAAAVMRIDAPAAGRPTWSSTRTARPAAAKRESVCQASTSAALSMPVIARATCCTQAAGDSASRSSNSRPTKAAPMSPTLLPAATKSSSAHAGGLPVAGAR
jgi:hypothetical protein